MRRRNLLKLGAGAALAGSALPLAAPAIAQTRAWPARPVKVIVPFAAGGGTDTVARPWCDKLSQIFGQQFVIENRGGASGLIGTEAAARSPADGYTFLISSSTTTVNLPLLRQVSYDPKSLEPIARMGDAVTGFAVHPSVGAKTFQEMLDYCKKNPDKLAFGSSGPGTGPHLRLEMLKYRTGVEILHVPYRGGADSLTDLLAGHVQMMNEPVTTPHVKAGKLYLLNINHFERSPDFPDIPTLTELGYPNSDAPIWISLWCPAGTPAEIKQRLNEEIVKEAKGAEMRDKLRMVGSAAVVQSIPELEAFREADATLMAELIKVAKIKIE
ncbi:MAG: Bug family tripartite tricarboxylate transporter substrate binding protein [Acetobacteraceae bacterium]